MKNCAKTSLIIARARRLASEFRRKALMVARALVTSEIQSAGPDHITRQAWLMGSLGAFSCTLVS